MLGESPVMVELYDAAVAMRELAAPTPHSSASDAIIQTGVANCCPVMRRGRDGRPDALAAPGTARSPFLEPVHTHAGTSPSPLSRRRPRRGRKATMRKRAPYSKAPAAVWSPSTFFMLKP